MYGERVKFIIIIVYYFLYCTEVSGCKRLCKPVIPQVTCPQVIMIYNLTQSCCNHIQYSLRNDLLSPYCILYHTRAWLVVTNIVLK